MTVQNLQKLHNHHILLIAVVGSGVFQCYGIDQLIVGQESSVAVIDISSCTGQADRAQRHLIHIGFLRIRAFHNLKLIQMYDKHGKHHGKDATQREQTRGRYPLQMVPEVFKDFFKQTSSHSSSSFLQTWHSATAETYRSQASLIPYRQAPEASPSRCRTECSSAPSAGRRTHTHTG